MHFVYKWSELFISQSSVWCVYYRYFPEPRAVEPTERADKWDWRRREENLRPACSSLLNMDAFLNRFSLYSSVSAALQSLNTVSKPSWIRQWTGHSLETWF